MSIPTGGSYTLDHDTGELKLVERTFDPAETPITPAAEAPAKAKKPTPAAE